MRKARIWGGAGDVLGRRSLNRAGFTTSVDFLTTPRAYDETHSPIDSTSDRDVFVTKLKT